MKVFHCDHCGHLLFFENTQCVKCGRLVAYLPDLALVGSLDRYDESMANDTIETWRSPLETAGRVYRLCENYAKESVCNWAVEASDPHTLCVSCRLTHVIPDLTTGEHRPAWYRLEAAKRRLIFTLLRLRLPIVSRTDDPAGGLAFEFKSDALTGHATGVITVNIAEADDAERERRRTSLHEPYRTLVGHFRHEIGHYYWDRLIAGRDALERFRASFGDERPIMARHSRPTTPTARQPTGRSVTSAPMRARTRSRTGRRRGHTTSTWSTRLKRRRPAVSRCNRVVPTSRR